MKPLVSKFVGLLKAALFVLAIVFVLNYVLKHWNSVDHIPFPKAGPFIAAVLLGFVSYSLRGAGSQYILARHGFHIPFHRVLGLVFVPLLGKFIPGKVWSLMAALHMYGREGVPRRVTGTTVYLAMATSLVAAYLVALIFGSSLISQHIGWWPFLGTCVGAAALVCPPVFYSLANRGLRLLHREPIEDRLSARSLSVAIAIQALSRVVIALGFFALINSFYSLNISNLPHIIALFTLAQVTGFIALFAPGGIGVSEGVLMLGLQGLVGTGPAIVITVVFRLWQTSLDLVMAGIGGAGLRYRSPEIELAPSNIIPPMHRKKFQFTSAFQAEEQ